MIVFKQGWTSRNMKFAIAMLAVMMLMPFVAHADSTQQYNKIFLNPFYKDTLTNNANTTFSVTIDPPDRIVSVVNAVVTFSIQSSGQTINYTLWVNNRSCSTPSYFVSTTFAAAGQKSLMYDCSNVINASGKYNVTIFPSGGNTGATNAWLDLTYMNSPTGAVTISGTDYYAGETATVFLQLLDADKNAVNNASCNFDMYNTTNPLSTPIYYKQPMVFRGADGVYYYQFSLNGLAAGTYPVDAECSYVYDNVYYNTGINESNVTTNSGTFQGGSPINLNSGSDSLYMSWSGTPINITVTWYNISKNITQMTLIWLGESDAIRTVTFYAQNWTSGGYVSLGSITLTGGGGNPPTGYDELFTANYQGNLSDFINSTGAARVQIFTTGAQRFNMNWLTLKVFRNSTYVSDVKGSSEVHIYPLNISDMPQRVWNFTGNGGRTLTDYNTTGISNSLADNFTKILGNLTAMPSSVWSYASRSLTDYNSTVIFTNTQTIISLLNGMSNLTAEQVWNFTGGRNLTFIDWQAGAAFVWNSTTRELTNYNMTGMDAYLSSINATVTTNKGILTGMANLTAQQVWEYVSRNLTYYPIVNISNLTVNVNASDIANQVWNFTTRDLTEYNNSIIYGYVVSINGTVIENNALLKGASNLTAAQVWAFAVRDLTNYNNTGIFNLVTQINATTQASNLSAAQIWSYSTRSLTEYNNSNMSAEIWAFSPRTLTEYNTSQLFAYAVSTNALAAEVNATTHDTLNNVSALYALNLFMNSTLGTISTAVNSIWNILTGMNLTLTQVNTTVNAINATAARTELIVTDINGTVNIINTTVWEINQTLGEISNMTIELNVSIWASLNDTAAILKQVNYINTTVKQINSTVNSMPTAVWNFTGGRNLTYYNTTQIYSLLTGMSNLTAAQVWNYTGGRNLTDYNNTEIIGLLKGLANITASDVWTYSNRTLTFVDYQMQALFVWNSSTRELTNYNSTQIYNAINGIPAATWAYATRTLTDYNNTEAIGLLKGLANITASDVWAFSNRSLTYFNYSAQALFVWNETTRELTEYNTTNLQSSIDNTPSLVWSFANRSLTEINITNVTAIINVSQIWEYSNRSLTYYNTTEIYGLLTGMSNLTASDVWAFSGRNLTYFDYATQALYVWNSTTRELTFYNSSNLSAADVWTFSTRELTEYNNSAIMSNLTSIGTTVDAVNSTTTSIYSYLTGTIKPLLDFINATTVAVQLTVNSIYGNINTMNMTLNSINSSTSGINQTINDINQTVNQINSTVNWINQSLVPNTIYIW